MQRTTELVKLSEKWRIVDDPLQWILQRRGNANGKFGPWQARSFCTTRTALLSNIRERAGEVDPVAVAFVETWPERHADGADRAGVAIDCLKKSVVPDAAQTVPQSDARLRDVQVPERDKIVPSANLGTEAA